jgi:hypothetical protein
MNGDTTNNIFVFFSSSGFSTSPAGSYAIQPFGFSQNPNYTLQFGNGTLTIVAPPPPTLNPFTTVTTVTYVPGTVNPTNPTLTTPATLDPTTLTPDEINPVGPAITVNPLIGTPLQIFGPLAETILDQFAAAFNPPLDLGSILIALKDPAAGPTIMVMIENFMYAELDNIMDKPQSSWTTDETAFVNGFLNYINAQRAAAANKAMVDYEAWAKATVAAEDAKIKQDAGQVQLMEIAALSANPPVPPNDFLYEASDGMIVSASQAQTMLAETGAIGDLESVMNGTASAAYMTYLTGQTFSVLGKGWTTFNGSVKDEAVVPEQIKNAFDKNGSINRAVYNKLTPEQRAQIRQLRDAKESGGDVETSTNVENTGSEAGKGASTTTSEVKTGTTVLKDIDTTFDVVETVGRIASVAGVVGEAAAIILQTAITATQYAEQAAYNDAFSAAVKNALNPIGVSDLKAMMSSGQAMTYLMAEMAGGNPNKIDSTNILTNAKPDMPLSQILAIEKNF